MTEKKSFEAPILFSIVLKKNDRESAFLSFLKQLIPLVKDSKNRILIYNNSGIKLVNFKELGLFVQFTDQIIFIDIDNIRNKFESGNVNVEIAYLNDSNSQIIVNNAFLLKVIQSYLFEISNNDEIICILYSRKIDSIRLLFGFLIEQYSTTKNEIIFFTYNKKLASIIYKDKSKLAIEPLIFNFNSGFFENHYRYLLYISKCLNFQIYEENYKNDNLYILKFKNEKTQSLIVKIFIESLIQTSYGSYETFLTVFKSKLIVSKRLNDYYTKKINPELIRNNWKKSNEDINLIINNNRNLSYKEHITEKYHINQSSLKTIGQGTEGYICTEGEWVYKFFFKPYNNENIIKKIIQLSKLSNVVYPIQIDEIHLTNLIKYKFEESKIYSGGYKEDIVDFLKKCQELELLFWDFKKANFRVTKYGLKLIDYGASFEEYNELIYRQSCLKAFLMYKYHWLNSWDFKFIAKKIDQKIYLSKYFGKNIYQDLEKDNFLDILFRT